VARGSTPIVSALTRSLSESYAAFVSVLRSPLPPEPPAIERRP
jgi:hypothetical protein